LFPFSGFSGLSVRGRNRAKVHLIAVDRSKQ
jgi:hypothetical protein